MGSDLKPIGDTFVNAIKMVITPIIFVTVVAGIAGVADLRGVGRIGGKAILYFEAVTTGGARPRAASSSTCSSPARASTPSRAVSKTVAGYVATAKEQSPWHLLTDIVPSSVVGAFSEGDILQVLFFAVLFGIAVRRSAGGYAGRPRRRAPVRSSSSGCSSTSCAAPIGAFGAMAYTVGSTACTP